MSNDHMIKQISKENEGNLYGSFKGICMSLKSTHFQTQHVKNYIPRRRQS